MGESNAHRQDSGAASSRRSSAAGDQPTKAPNGSEETQSKQQDHPQLLAGGKFGRYRIVRPLGQGGMGTVYLAHDTQLDRSVALKIPQLQDDPAALERFYREARAAATLNHPHLCQVFDVGQIERRHYLTMAFVKGRPLSDYVKSGRVFPLRQIAVLIRKLALALQQAHEQGVIHRDIKPSNVMMTENHQPVVVDFGLARRSGKDSQLTQTGASLGTPTYMPPEQVQAKPGEMGPACDIYSLGIVLYEMIAGRPPFQGDAMAVIAQIVCDAPPLPKKFRNDLDPQLQAICLKAIAKKPAERFATMKQFAGALGRYVSGREPADQDAPSEARPAGGLEELLDEELPKLEKTAARLAPSVQPTLHSPQGATVPEVKTRPKKERREHQHRQRLAMAAGIVAVGYGGIRALAAFRFLPMIAFLSFGSMIGMISSLGLGVLGAYLAFLGIGILQKDEESFDRAGKVAMAFIVLVLVTTILGTIGSGAAGSMDALDPSVRSQRERMKMLAEQQTHPALRAEFEKQLEQFDALEDVSASNGWYADSTQSWLVAGWILLIAEFLPLSFIVFAAWRVLWKT